MALLSPLLEKLVFNNEAVVKTTVIGKSGHAVIPVGKDRTIIVIEFDYQHFIDFIDPDDLDEVLMRSVHQLSFKSSKSESNFIIRDNVQTLEIAGPTFVTTVNGEYNKETFLIHFDDVIIQIVAAPPVTGTVSIPGVAPADLSTQQPPFGYGSGATGIVQTVNETDAAATTEYVPLDKSNTPFLGATPFPVSRLLFPVNVSTALNPTFNADEKGQRTYPIVNITYIEILRSLSGELFTSS